MIFSSKNKLALVLVSLFILAACTRPTGMPSGSGVELSAKEDENIDLKLKYYKRNCIDPFSSSVATLHEDYLQAVDLVQGPVSEESVPYLYTLDSPENCAIAINKAKEMGVAKELDPLAQDFLSTLKPLVPLVAQATRYYEQMDYKMDGFAKGKELHPQLIAAFDQFKKADTAFRKAFDEAKQALDLRLLQGFKQNGQEFEFLVQDAWIKGGLLLKKAQEQDYASLDAEVFSLAVNEYQASLEALDAYLLQYPQAAELVGDFQQSSWDYMVEAKQLMHRKLENQPYDEYEGNAEMMSDEYDWVIDYYPL